MLRGFGKTVRFSAGLLSLAALLLAAEPAHAYIGPGAGFAFLGSAFVFLLTLLMALVTIAFWPLQWASRRLRGKRISKNARTRRVVIVGLDGLEPTLIEKYMTEGLLPNFKALKEEGGYKRLGTTLPSLSPVAWSTFQTGVNPGAHNIFDFLTRDKRYCLPNLSSTRTNPSKRLLSLGKFVYPLDKPKIELLRKSQPFWRILSKYGIFSNIIRVPISYPPEKFYGNILSAMCTPDLKGTQGSFTVFTTENGDGARHTGGQFSRVEREGREVQGLIEGPCHPFRKEQRPLTVPFSMTLYPEREEAELRVADRVLRLTRGEFSEWVEVKFRFGLWSSVSGICRFCLRELEPELFLYMSPLNVNPEKPALPIAHPIFFASYLAKRHGLYGTLGLLEDTWGRNEHALDDKRFLEQAYLTHEEREKMFFDALERTREGVCACVFDASDRIQHMFWRYLDELHPSPREENPEFANAIPEMYRKMDDLVGRVRAALKPEDVLIVLSDHGFTSFRRCNDINSWLHREGYLALKNGAATDADYLQDVDWSKTRAFALGLAGIYLNRKGRERFGIVEAHEVEGLKREIAEKLEQLCDPQTGERVIHRVYDSARAYRGVYRDDACDLIIGCKPGYRVSWESVTGGLSTEVFEDNLKAWSGDHDVDPSLVPGILFTNRPITAENPRIIDMAPTVLDLFAVPIPAYMEGKAVL